jgi:hypothetical protein
MAKTSKLIFINNKKKINNKNITKKTRYKTKGKELILRSECGVGLQSFEKKYQRQVLDGFHHGNSTWKVDPIQFHVLPMEME